MAEGTSLWTRISRWLRSQRLQQHTQERFLKTTWAALFLVGATAVFLDIWQDGVILVKGVPVLTTLGAALFAVTLSSVLTWRLQEAWHEKSRKEELTK